MFVLDTDHLVIIQRRAEPHYGRLLTRMSRCRSSDVYVTTVSLHEQMMGANALISRAKDPAQVVRGYRLMDLALHDFSAFQVLPFDEPASEEFTRLRQARVRIGTMDLRIAAIALQRQMRVVTRNLRDFRKVPNLQCEDWTA